MPIWAWNKRYTHIGFFYWKSIVLFEFKLVLYLNLRSLSHFINRAWVGYTKWVGCGQTCLRQAGFGDLAVFFFSFFLLLLLLAEFFTNQMGLDLAFGPC